jgi:Arc/MetJ-type ribon-helix-helix transcriptional regulator
MKVVTINLQESTLELISKLVEAGIFENKGEAIRRLVVEAIPEYLRLVRMEEEEEPSRIIAVREAKLYRRGPKIHLSFKVSKTMNDTISQVYQKAGYMSKSEFIRAAIMEKILRVL